jgi:predicted DNA-binding protein (MmcQ/YjbR family)
MNVEELHNYCLSFKGVVETFPFDDVSLVLKVEGKMFALIPLDELDLQIAVKCDPDKAVELREKYECVQPAYHFNKKYWNTIFLTGEMKDDEVKQWICHSIAEVMKKLPKRVRDNYYCHCGLDPQSPEKEDSDFRQNDKQ